MSEIKVNKISPRSGTTVTLGDSGDTFTIPSGATINNQGTAVNFGATGAASWDTTVKTTGFTAVSGVGYFVNTTAGAISVNLPAGTAGDVVAIKDYAGTFDTNGCTLVQNGSDKIGGSAVNSTLTTEGIAVTLVFIDSTQGWLVTDSGLQTEAPTAQYVTATGGTITCSGNFRIHTFTGPGNFCVSCVGNAAGSNSVDYLVVAGGGGGGNYYGAGGGAGGVRMSAGTATGCYTVGPLGSGVAALPVSATNYPITIGAGGPNGVTPAPVGSPTGKIGVNGSNSSALSIISTGGGFGAGVDGGSIGGGSGGSGGGAAASTGSGVGGAGNTPPVSPPQGQDGAAAPTGSGGGGGGATAAGTVNGPGGNGVSNMINPATGDIRSSVSYYGGGGNSSNTPFPVNAPLGGGGGGSMPNSQGSGVINTGGGGGGNSTSSSQAGGSGIVVIRYKFQN